MNQNVISNSNKTYTKKSSLNLNMNYEKSTSLDLELDKQSHESLVKKQSYTNGNNTHISNFNLSIEMIRKLVLKNSKIRNSYVNPLLQEKLKNETNEKTNLSNNKTLNYLTPPKQILKCTNFHSKRLASMHISTQINNNENTPKNSGFIEASNSSNTELNDSKSFYIPNESYFTDNSNIQLNETENNIDFKINYSAKTTDMIAFFKKVLIDVQHNNLSLINKISSSNPKLKCFSDLNKTCFYSITEKDNILKDIYYESKIFHQYRSYLKRKQEIYHSGNKQMFSTFKDEQQGTLSDDIVCVICNDGDYEEDNLIVYCAVSFKLIV
jgi:hypothetical protein